MGLTAYEKKIMYKYEKWIDYMNVAQSTDKPGFPK